MSAYRSDPLAMLWRNFCCSLLPLLVLAAAQNVPPGLPTGPATPTFTGANVPSNAPDRIIVKYKSKGGIGPQGRGSGVKVPVPQGETVETTVKKYKEKPEVEYAEPDRFIAPDLLPNDPKWSVQWGLVKVGADKAWDKTTGSSAVTVCVVDSGVNYKHPDLAPNMHPQIGLNAITGEYGDPYDDLGHGTHVAGIIAASGNNRLGTAGVDWNVKLLACKFMDSAGYGMSSDAVECIDYCVGAGARVISASWSFPSYSQSVYDAILAAKDRDVIFISSAGNKATDMTVTPNYPPNYGLPNQVVVASSGYTDDLSSFSNYGKTVAHLAAPGEYIMSTLFTNNDYGYMSGTSMATPIVSGAAALILGASGNTLTVDRLRSLLLSTVTPVASLKDKLVTGGRLNLDAALRSYTDSLMLEACKANPASCTLQCDDTLQCKWTLKQATVPPPSPSPKPGASPAPGGGTSPVCTAQPALCVLQCSSNNVCTWVEKSSIPKTNICKKQPKKCVLKCSSNNVCQWVVKPGTTKSAAVTLNFGSWV